MPSLVREPSVYRMRELGSFCFVLLDMKAMTCVSEPACRPTSCCGLTGALPFHFFMDFSLLVRHILRGSNRKADGDSSRKELVFYVANKLEIMGKTQALFWIRETYHTSNNLYIWPFSEAGATLPSPRTDPPERTQWGRHPTSSRVFREGAASGERLGEGDQEKHQTLRVKTFSDSECVVFTLHGV